MMKRLALALASAALLVAAASTAEAAPGTTGSGGNHPAFPQECVGGPFEAPTFGWVVVANGSALARGTLPTGFFYPGGDFVNPPDFDAVAPIVGVSMYRTTLELEPDGQGGFDLVSFVGQGRSNGNGNKALDEGQAISDAIERVTARWDVAMCQVTIPGFILADLYPEADPPYDPTHFYNLLNYVK